MIRHIHTPTVFAGDTCVCGHNFRNDIHLRAGEAESPKASELRDIAKADWEDYLSCVNVPGVKSHDFYASQRRMQNSRVMLGGPQRELGR